MNHAQNPSKVSQPPAFADGVANPLSVQERAEATEVAGRLKLELRSLLELVPDSQRGASALSRTLDLDRNICQRILAATTRGHVEARMLVQLPGVPGLRQFLAAVAPLLDAAGRARIGGAHAAVDTFDELIDRLAGSQRRLRERMDADPALADESTTPVDDLPARKALFRSAAEIVGRWSQTSISLSVIQPDPADPQFTHSLRVFGHIGHIARRLALPLEIGGTTQANLTDDTGPALAPLVDGEAGTEATRVLLKEFCSTPYPRVVARQVGASSIYAIDSNTGDQPADILIASKRASRDRHPATSSPPLGEVSKLVTMPARQLVFDVYLHRDIAKRCTPSLEIHLWGPHIGQQGLWRWSTRFPGGPRLQLLGAGLANASTPAYPRHAELTAHVFGRSGWDPAQFIGYRCEVAYPVWRAGYFMLFDFGNNELPKD